MAINVMDGMAMSARLRTYWPILITLCVSAAYVIWRLSNANWDPVALAELGTVYADGIPTGSGGYDGQFAYYIALDPDPYSVEEHLDVPAYRYQRILYPILSRVLAGATSSLIPWSLLIVNLVSHAIGTWAVIKLLLDYGSQPRYSLIYGLWVGLIATVGLDLNEPLAHALVATGWLARHRGKFLLSATLLGLALFTKESTLLFWGAALVTDLLVRKEWRSVSGLIAGGVVFIGWQLWLWHVFGSPGLGSGGAMATPFELIPFMGMWRIGGSGIKVLGLFILVFGTTIAAPALWGLIASARAVRQEWATAENWGLLSNSLLIVFLPFSTFREPLGLLRVATGFVLAVILFAANRSHKRALNYGMFWISLLVVLLNVI
jgi:hypothetical protein